MPIMVHTPNQSNSKTGVPPIFMNADGGALTSWSISGQTVQNGTPTPDAPIYPEFVGERTKNICKLGTTTTFRGVTFTVENDGTVAVSGRITSADNSINVRVSVDIYGDGEYIFSGCPDGGSDNTYHAYMWDYTDGARCKRWDGTTSVYNETGLGQQVKIISGHEVGYCIRVTAGITYENIVFKPMIRLRNTTADFEPYGYKLPITCGSQTTPIYLGQVQTVRRIKKLVLTGEETDGFVSSGRGYIRVRDGMQETIAPYSDKLVGVTTPADESPAFSVKQLQTIFQSVISTSLLIKSDVYFNAFSDFQDWLRENAPITIWYVLAEPAIAIVNEPLAKIGNYSDAVASTNTGAPSIITSEGYQNLTVDTTVQPSNVSVSYNLPEFSECSHIYVKTDGLPQTKTGTTPLTFKASNDGLSECAVSGQTTQNGTPSPSAPVSVDGCGDKTENYFDDFQNLDFVPRLADGQLVSYYGGACTDLIPITDGNMFLKSVAGNFSIYVFLYAADKSYIGYATNGNNGISSANVSGAENARFLRVRTDAYSRYRDDPRLMLNTGSTAKPYEPSGYKLPLTCANTTTPSYIGSNPIHKIGNYTDVADVIGGSVRRKIKKLVLTGTEDWIYQSDYNRYLITISDAAQFVVRQAPMLCTHYQVIDDGRPISDVPNNSVYFNNQYLCITTTDQTSKTDFNNYLSAQYAAGTPVVVWYVLASETTEQITPITIPTADGENTLSVDTTVQPSSVTIGYDAPEYSEVTKVLDAAGALI